VHASLLIVRAIPGKVRAFIEEVRAGGYGVGDFMQGLI